MKYLFFFLFCCLTALSNGYADVSTFSENSFHLEKIFENSETCINQFENDRIYLNIDRIKITDRGNYLRLDNEEIIPLAIIYSDDKGSYITCNDFEIKDYWFYKCPGCGIMRSINSDYCNNPKCPYYRPW